MGQKIKHRILSSVLICLILIFTNSLIAGKKTKKDKLKKKIRIIAAPLAFYTPETKFAFGCAGSFIFRLSGKNQNTRPSTISPLIIYTLNKQFKAQVKTDLFFNNDKFRMTSFFNVQKFPDKFYGIGNNTKEDARENYTSNSKLFTLSIQKKIRSNFNIGLQCHFMNWTISEKLPGGGLDILNIPGNDGGTISGLGLIFTYDTRDNIFAPLSGNLLEINSKTYLRFIGSDFEYTDLTLDLRHYFSLFSDHVLAVQTKIRTQFGEVPFIDLAKLGGEFNMRGYYNGRYRDKNMFLLQMEYRLPLFWKIGLAGAVGFGHISDKFTEFHVEDIKISYGFGLRFLFDKKEKINIRLDIGFGENGSSIYVSIYEAF